MNRKKLLLRGSIVQGLESLVAIVVGLITLPLMLNHLGADLYGVWVLIGGFVGLLYIFDLGFATSVTRSVASSVARKDHYRTNCVINSALFIYIMLAAILGLVILIAVWLYTPTNSLVISVVQLKLVMAIVGLSIVIEFPFKAFAGLSASFLRYDLIASYRIIIKLIHTAFLVYLLFNDYGLVAIALLHLMLGLCSNVSFVLLAKYSFTELKINTKLISRTIVKELYNFSTWAFVIDISRLLKERIDLFFIGGFLSLSAVSIYYVPVRVVQYSMRILYKSLGLSLPIFASDAQATDPQKFWENIIFFNRVNCYCSVVTFIFYLIFGKTIIYYWMGNHFDYESAYYVLMILLGGRLSAFASSGFNNALYATGKHKILAFANIYEAIFTGVFLWLSLAVLNQEMMWAAISISVPLIISRLIWLPILSIKRVQLSRGYELAWKSYRPLLCIILSIIINSLFSNEPILGMHHLFKFILMSVALIIFISIDIMPREKNYLKTLWEGVLGSKNKISFF